MEKIKKWLSENYLYLLMWAAFSAVMCLLVFPQCSADFINYDSSYQYFLTQHSLPEIMRLLPEDYSPPFYALTLKLFTMLFGNTLYVMRVFNLGAIIGMLGLAAFPVRRAFGVKASVFCSVLFTCSYIHLTLMHEIRPTYYSIFYFTGVAIYSYLAFFEGKRSDNVLMVVYSVIAMYTHNIAMLGTLGVYITLLLFSLVTRSKKKFKCFFVSGIICAVVYLPWLFVVFHQFNHVLTAQFWESNPSSFKVLLNWTVFAPFNYGQGLMTTAFYVVAVAMVCVLIIRSINWNSLKGATKFSSVIKLYEDRTVYIKAAFSVTVYVMAVALLMAFSLIVYPFATDRYFAIFSGSLLIVVAAALGNCKLKIMSIVMMALLGLNFIFANLNIVKDLDRLITTHDFMELLENEDVTFLHSHEFTLGTMLYHFPEAKHIVFDDTYTVTGTYDVFPSDVVEIGDIGNLSQYGKEFYIKYNGGHNVDEPYAPTDFLDEAGIEYELTEVGTYYMFYSYMTELEIAKITLTEAS